MAESRITHCCIFQAQAAIMCIVKQAMPDDTDILLANRAIQSSCNCSSLNCTPSRRNCMHVRRSNLLLMKSLQGNCV